MSERTHIRRPDHTSWCGLTQPVESLSLRHWLIASSTETDIIDTYDSHQRRVPVDRAAAIRDGVETLPHPVCQACIEGIRAES